MNNTIYEQAKDLHVASVILYSKVEEVDDEDINKLYWTRTVSGGEATFTNPVKESELKDLFIKNTLIIDDGNVLLKPHVLDGNMIACVASLESEDVILATEVYYFAKSEE